MTNQEHEKELERHEYGRREDDFTDIRDMPLRDQLPLMAAWIASFCTGWFLMGLFCSWVYHLIRFIWQLV